MATNIQDKINKKLYDSITSGNMTNVKLLLEFVDIKSENCDALSVAYGSKNDDMVKYLIDQGADINDNGNMLLKKYVRDNNISMVNYLLDKKADIKESLYVAAECGNMTMIKLLLDRGANISIEGGDVVALSASNGHIDIVKLMISLGVNINEIVTPDELMVKEIALIYATKNGHTNIVKLLLDHGAIPLFTDDDYKKIKNDEIRLLITNYYKIKINDLMEKNKILQEENDIIKKQLDGSRTIVYTKKII